MIFPGDAEEMRQLRREAERNLRLVRTGPNSWRYVDDPPGDDDGHQDDNDPKAD